MTREEAKAWFKVLLKAEGSFNTADREAFEMAIKALEQEPILDKIRAEIEELVDAKGYGDYQLGFNFGLMRAAQVIDKYKAESEEV